MTSELGEFLRARRGRLQPGDVGLPAGARPRRTPGLRREELAALAGVSIDYYIRLERGKENPSGAVLNALARALRLGHEERAHLYALANHAARRTPHADTTEDTVGPGIRLLLATVRPCPAYVLNHVSDIVAANPEALALLAGIEDWPSRRRNTVRYTFLHSGARTLYDDWDHAAAQHVAHLRTVLADHPGDPCLTALVTELKTQSSVFAALWERHDVQRWRGAHKTFHHPEVGEITLASETLYLDNGQRVSIYQAPPHSRDQDALALLSAATSLRSSPDQP